MAIYMRSLGDSETGARLYRLTNELAYAMGAEFDLETAPVMKAADLILTANCVGPTLGVLAVSSSLRRSENVYYSSGTVDFAEWSSADPQPVIALANGFSDALNRVPTSILSAEINTQLVGALRRAAIRLSEEPDRLR